jgi:hypothetical protein
MKKYIFYFILIIGLIGGALFAFNYYVPYSEGWRAGKLVKFSRKGVIVKTWEGELSTGIGQDHLWDFSVEDNKKLVIEKMVDYQGKGVKIKYVERFWTISWLGETKYFAKEIVLDKEAETISN